jgi:predicted alpha/beta-hydrolase family hydrolase
MKVKISPSIGTVTAEATAPKSMKAMFTFAHGAGAGMGHPFMTTMSKELAGHGIGTLRFNFPYMEKKKGRPDVPAVAHQTIKALVEKAAKAYPDVPIFASGKSFGGRMSSQYLAKGEDTMLKGIVFFGFPLHAPGKPSIDRGDHLKEIKVPMLFLQGSRDDLAKWDLIESVCSGLSTAKLVRWEGADHSFKVSGKNILGDIAGAVNAWVDEVL